LKGGAGMSYSCEIYFKNIKADEVYSFFQKIKERAISKTDEIAKENFLWMPSIRNRHLYKDTEDFIVETIDEGWVLNSLFKYRYFYLPQHELLGVLSLPDGFDDMFDNVSYFQNSCDQDYEFDEWKGIPIFEQIAEKWKNATDEEVYKTFEYPDEYEEPIDYDYYRRSNAYDEIWGMCEKYLYRDEICVYLSIFGGYEHYHVRVIREKCKRFYAEWREQG
jgi:hypothetical protein